MLARAFLVIALAVTIAEPAAAATWRWPVDGEPARPFTVGPDRFAAGQHRGVDLAAPLGAPVRAACAGKVRFAGTVGSAGRTVSVRCGSLVASYLHLGSIATSRGRAIAADALIGTVGRSGAPRGGPHVHLGARRVADGQYVDPLTLLRRSAPASPPSVGPVPPPRAGPHPLPASPAVRAPRLVSKGVRPVPWPAVAGLALLVIAFVPATAARRRRPGHGLGHARVTGPTGARR
ncbi:MAG: peptidoglycan DD-metalloendopeptidase family protein [Solirubrobacteraceae bacterium]|nr:peptidoglycan DD-metalloendopeptidase family protein [Solirubrobacteraceae bacterium]